MARRSPKPWYRARNIGLLLVGAVGAVAVWMIVAAVTAKPGTPIKRGSQIQAIALRSQPAFGDDAYPPFILACDTLRVACDQAVANAGPVPNDFPRGAAWPFDFTSLGDPTLHPVVYRNSVNIMEAAKVAGLYDVLDTVAAAPRTVWPVRDDADEYPAQYMSSARGLARLTHGRMTLAAQAGDWDEFARAFDHGLAVGRTVDRAGALITHLVAVAIDALILERARDLVRVREISDAALVRMLAALARDRRPSTVDLLDAEYIAWLQRADVMFTDDGAGDGRLLVTVYNVMDPDGPYRRLGTHRIANLAGVVLPGKKSTVEKLDAYRDIIKAYATASPSARASLPVSPDTWTAALPAKYAPVKSLVAYLPKIIDVDVRHIAPRNAVTLVLALELYKRRHNNDYPPTLDALVPEILPALPVDPFSPRGTSYAYLRPGPGRDLAGAPYILYSVGPNTVDDHFGADDIRLDITVH